MKNKAFASPLFLSRSPLFPPKPSLTLQSSRLSHPSRTTKNRKSRPLALLLTQDRSIRATSFARQVSSDPKRREKKGKAGDMPSAEQSESTNSLQRAKVAERSKAEQDNTINTPQTSTTPHMLHDGFRGGNNISFLPYRARRTKETTSGKSVARKQHATSRRDCTTRRVPNTVPTRQARDSEKQYILPESPPPPASQKNRRRSLPRMPAPLPPRFHHLDRAGFHDAHTPGQH